MEKVLALYDSDFFYTMRFMEYMNQRKDSGFRVCAFTRKESLEEYLKSHPVEILLLGNEAVTEELLNVKFIYQLSDRPHKKSEKGLVKIFKYQSARVIMDEILSDYTPRKNMENKSEYRNETEVVSLFAPVPGAEKLFFAWSLNSLLSEKNKVLFVLFDPLPIPLFSATDNKNQSLTEFIYHLKEGSDPIEKMKPLLVQNGRSFLLSGTGHGADILSLNREDIQKWVKELRSSTEFQAVVFYLSCYSEAMLELMKLSDKSLTLMLNNPYETAVIKEWEQQMGRCGNGAVLDKIRYLRLQGEAPIVDFPITMQELMNSPVWEQAASCLYG